MNYTADDCQVVQHLGRGETNIVATCHNSRWAETIARLLNDDYHQAVRNSAGTSMVRIEGHDLESLRNMLGSNATGRKPYLLRVDQRSDAIAFKVNEGCWSHGMGKPQPAY